MLSSQFNKNIRDFFSVVGPTIVTSNPRTFTRALKNLYVQGGGDCPEMSVTAIRWAGVRVVVST